MSERSSECGARSKPEMTDDKKSSSRSWKKIKNSKISIDQKFKEEVNERSGSKFTNESIEPEVHRVSTNGISSLLASIRVIPNFQKSEASVSRIDQLAEASTSSGVRRSILREKDFTLNSDSTRFSRIRQFWSKYPTKETKKTIIFVDQRASDSSLESVVTLIGTSKPLIKSALRSTGSLRSTSSSVRFSLPPENLRQRNDTLMKIGNWEVVCDFGNDENTDNWTATWRTFRHTRICKIVMFLTFGLVVPSFLVVPVLVYEDISNITI